MLCFFQTTSWKPWSKGKFGKDSKIATYIVMSGENSTANVTPGQCQWTSRMSPYHGLQKVRRAGATEQLGQETGAPLLPTTLSLSWHRTFPAAQPVPCCLFLKDVLPTPQPGCEFSADCFLSHPGSGRRRHPLPAPHHYWSLLSHPLLQLLRLL